ncbi:MAG: group 1 glycosyl transferase [Flavobacteriales bacterium]|nr:group 1 glycosyl transferase [Flavobacteriales bacterium]
MKKVIVSVTTDLISDHRVHKMCLSLYNNGFDVTLVGRKKNSQKLALRPYKVIRFNMFFKKGFLFYMFFNLRLFFLLLVKKSHILISNDLDTILPNFLISKLKKLHIIYDSHELFTEVPELISKKKIKLFWLYLESNIFPKLKNVITVSDGYAKFYKKKYGNSITVIKNVPSLDPRTINNFSLPGFKLDEKNIIYQGSLNKDRGIDLMIKAVKFIDVKLFILGSGDLELSLQEYVIKENLTNKVFFVGRVPFNDLKYITKFFDLGLSFEENSCLAYRYSLPNKVFDYIHAGIPVLSSDLPEMSNFIISNKVGQTLSSREPKKIAEQILEVISNKNQYQKDIEKTKNKYCWQKEEKKLLKLFNYF